MYIVLVIFKKEEQSLINSVSLKHSSLNALVLCRCTYVPIDDEQDGQQKHWWKAILRIMPLPIVHRNQLH
jgi:hypothetical protein